MNVAEHEIEVLLAEDPNGFVAILDQDDLVPAQTKHRLDGIGNEQIVFGHKNAGHGCFPVPRSASTTREP